MAVQIGLEAVAGCCADPLEGHAKQCLLVWAVYAVSRSK